VSVKISSLDLWNKVLEAKLSTGSYYLISIDNANKKNMHDTTLTGSNLCTEIYQSTTTDCPAVCNLGSIVLSNLQGQTRQEQMADLRGRVQTLIRNLNVLIEHGDYATENPKEHNKGNRPLGIGIQGFSDRLVNLTSESGRKGIPYESIEAQRDAFEILENMSYGFWDYSCSLAEIHGPFKDFKNSKFSKGHLPHFYAKKVDAKIFGADEFNPWDENMKLKTTLDWDALSERVKQHGVYHSHGIAIMPTASTAIVTGSSPSNEPPQRLIYRHSTVSGTHDRLYMPMVNYLHRHGLWNEKVEHHISVHNSVQNIDSFVPMFSSVTEGIAALAKAKNMGFDLDHFKKVFKTAYEVSNRKVCILNYLMQIFVDQGISMNMSLINTDGAVIKLSKAIQFANMLGLSTLVYYLNFESKVKEAFLAKAECESCTA
jgi:ribonucleoside-diphosphate reductase alpha chain